MFAIEHFDVVPDLITMSKSIGAGVPISAVTGRAEVMDAPNPGEIGGTYGGSPLGCVAALEVIHMLQQERLIERANAIGETVIKRFRRLQEKYETIGDVRGLGAMVAIEFVTDAKTKTPNKELTAAILRECHQRGVIVMSAGLYSNVIRLLTPLVITDEQLEEALDVIEEVIAELA